MTYYPPTISREDIAMHELSLMMRTWQLSIIMNLVLWAYFARYPEPVKSAQILYLRRVK